MPYYLASTGGFYDTQVSPDAIEVSDYQRDNLLMLQALGKIITIINGEVVAIEPVLSIDQRRLNQRAIINSARDNVIFGGFLFDGHVYQSDPNSQTRITNSATSVVGTALLPTNFVWRTKDNVDVPMDEITMVALSAALQNHIASILAVSRELKDAIAVSDNPESILWPASIQPPISEPLLGSVVSNVPAAAKLASTALQPADLENFEHNMPDLADVAYSGDYADLKSKPAPLTLSAVATSGKYADLTGKPTLTPAGIGAATAAQGAKADTAIQQAAMEAAIATVTSQIPPRAVQIDITTNTSGVGTLTAAQLPTWFTSTSKIIPVWTVANQMGYFPTITAQTATSLSVTGWKTRATLLLSSGPIEPALNSTVRIAILP